MPRSQDFDAGGALASAIGKFCLPGGTIYRDRARQFGRGVWNTGAKCQTG